MNKRYCLDARTATDHFPGIGRYVSNIARGIAAQLAADEQLVLLVDPRQPSRWRLPPSSPQVEIIASDVSPFALAQQWRIPRLLRHLQIDLYHSPYYLMPYRPGVPTLLTVYDLIPLYFPDLVSRRARLFFTFSSRLAIAAADHLLAISAATREDFRREYGLKDAFISTVPLAPDGRFQPLPPPTVAAVRKRYELPTEHFLYLGINKPHKNLPLLVRAWQNLAEEYHALPPLIIAGAWDNRYPEAKELVQQQYSGCMVRFLGPVSDEDLPALYNSALGFIFPSLYEGFGLPVIEAMACGTAVICADSSSLPEIAGEAALLFPPEDEADLQRCVLRIWQDEQLRVELEQKGIIRSADYSWQTTADRTLAHYRRMNSSSS